MNSDGLARRAIRARLERPVVDSERRLPSVEELRKTERNPLFRRLCENRLLFGAFRYQSFAEGAQTGRRHRNVESAIYRLQRYLEDGNTEHLVDVANLCEIEFDRPGSHPRPHFHAEDDGVHKTMEV